VTDLSPDNGRVALVAARTERTWEALTVLQAASVNGEPVRVQFPFACEILGIYPSVSQASNNGAGRTMPTLDDLIVSIAMNQDVRFTSRFSELNASTQSQEVTLGAFRDTMGGARTTLIDVSRDSTGVDQNDLVCTFKWKAQPIAAVLYEDVTVGMAFLIRKKG
jgi:hypothetical protein